MKVVIIGSGNVATHLAKALHQADIEIVQIWSHHLQNASILAQEVNAKPICNITKIDLTADVCLVSVKDEAIATVVHQLIGFKGIIAHTAGAESIDVFKGLFANYGVFYPLQTFSKVRAIALINVPFCLEASTVQTLSQLKTLALKLSKKVVEINSEQRKTLHLAAVFACNFPNHLYNIAAQLLNEKQLDFNMLKPLIFETAEKIQSAMPNEVQTGPAIRDDQETMRKHLLLLKDKPAVANIYQIISDSIKKGK